MQSACAFERDPYLRHLDLEILSVGEQDGRHYAVVNDTVLYPEGGGQPADHGTLGNRAVVDVQRVGGELRYYLEGADAPAPGPARVQLNWERRYDHMQQHTAQHLLSAVASTRFGWETTAFHLGAHRSDVELDAPGLSADEMETLEEAVAQEVRAAHLVSCRRVAPDELEGLGVRSRGLPAGHTGSVRLVEIAGIDLNTCGGTHLRCTAEIETLKLLGSEPMRGGCRLYWVAGRRVRRLLGDHEARAATLRSLLDTGDSEIAATVAARLDRLREADRQVRGLQRDLSGEIAARLAGGGETVVELHLEPAEPGFLQQLGRQLCELAPAKRAMLTGTGTAGHFFVVVAGADSGLDLAAAGRSVAALLDGRGGGTAGVFQGPAGSLSRRAEAFAVLSAQPPA